MQDNFTSKINLISKIDDAIYQQKEINFCLDQIKAHLFKIQDQVYSLENHIIVLKVKMDFYFEKSNSRDRIMVGMINAIFYFVLGLILGYLFYLFNK